MAWVMRLLTIECWVIWVKLAMMGWQGQALGQDPQVVRASVYGLRALQQAFQTGLNGFRQTLFGNLRPAGGDAPPPTGPAATPPVQDPQVAEAMKYADKIFSLMRGLADQTHDPGIRSSVDALQALFGTFASAHATRQAIAEISSEVESLRQELRTRPGPTPTPYPTNAPRSAPPNAGTGSGPRSWAQMAAGSQPAIPPRRQTEVLLDKVPAAHDLETLRSNLNAKFDTNKIIATRRLPSGNVVLSCVDKSTADRVSLSTTSLSQVVGTTVEVRPQLYRVMAHSIPINAFTDLRTPEGRAEGCKQFQARNQHITGMVNIAWFNPRHKPDQTEATLIVMFRTPQQADDAIRHGLAWGPYLRRVEIFTPAGTATQCYKCQRHGHVVRSCPNAARCALCAAGHESRDCPSGSIIRSQPHKAKCPNCGEPHPAWSGLCAVRSRYQDRAREARTTKAPFYGGGTYGADGRVEFMPFQFVGQSRGPPANAPQALFRAGEATATGTERNKRQRGGTRVDEGGFQTVAPRGHKAAAPRTTLPEAPRPRGRPPAPVPRSGDIRLALAPQATSTARVVANSPVDSIEDFTPTPTPAIPTTQTTRREPRAAGRGPAVAPAPPAPSSSRNPTPDELASISGLTAALAQSTHAPGPRATQQSTQLSNLSGITEALETGALVGREGDPEEDEDIDMGNTEALYTEGEWRKKQDEEIARKRAEW